MLTVSDVVLGACFPGNKIEHVKLVLTLNPKLNPKPLNPKP